MPRCHFPNCPREASIKGPRWMLCALHWQLLKETSNVEEKDNSIKLKTQADVLATSRFSMITEEDEES